MGFRSIMYSKANQSSIIYPNNYSIMLCENLQMSKFIRIYLIYTNTGNSTNRCQFKIDVAKSFHFSSQKKGSQFF